MSLKGTLTAGLACDTDAEDGRRAVDDLRDPQDGRAAHLPVGHVVVRRVLVPQDEAEDGTLVVVRGHEVRADVSGWRR